MYFKFIYYLRYTEPSRKTVECALLPLHPFYVGVVIGNGGTGFFN
jgi:hypothetical protein